MNNEAQKEFTSGEKLAYFILTRLKPGELVFEDSKSFKEIIESDEFKKIAPEILTDFAVSGMYNRKMKTLINETDLDGKSTLGLLEAAGFDISKTKYMLPGKSEMGVMNIDSGGYHGIVVEGDILKDEINKITAWCDNHGKESRQYSTSAEFMYEALCELKLLEKNEILERIIELNRKVESGDFDWESEYWNSYKTPVGLGKFMTFQQLYDFFRSGRTYDDEITGADYERWQGVEFLTERQKKLKKEGKKFKTLEDMRNQHKRMVEGVRPAGVELEKDGLIVETALGKVLVNPNGRFAGGYAAAYALGADGSLSWSPEEDSFALSMRKGEIPAGIQGITIRGHIHLKPSWDGGRLSASLEEVLKKIGYTGEPSEALKKLFIEDKRNFRGEFQVFPERGSDGINYVAFTKTEGSGKVFSVFPKGWKPKSESDFVKVHVAEVKTDSRGKPFFLLEPDPDSSAA